MKKVNGAENGGVIRAADKGKSKRKMDDVNFGQQTDLSMV